MINLSPIAKTIQERLFEKMRVLGRKKPKINESVKGKAESPLEMKDMATRSTFIRMVSGQENPVVMMGGEIDDKTMRAGFKNIYGTRHKDVRAQSGVWGAAERKQRPMAGIKSIDVQFKGGTRALRTANINWTCWTFEDVDRLRSHFLTHGRTVGLEWGWVYNKKDFTDMMAKHSLISKEGIIKKEAFGDYRNNVLGAKGDFDFMYGVIKNFEFTSRDDGGFDCQTQIVSTGVNMFDMDGGDGGESTRLLTLYNISEKDTDKEKIVKLKNLLDDKTRQETIFWHSDINFSIFMENIENILANYYAKEIKAVVTKDNLDTWVGDAEEREKSEEQSVMEKIYSFETRKEQDQRITKMFLTQEFLAINDAILIHKAQGTERNVIDWVNETFDWSIDPGHVGPTLDMWITWGWFEDNILSKFVSFIAENPEYPEEGKILNELRSIERVLNPDGTATSDFVGTKIRNHPGMTTTNYNNFILPGQFNVLDWPNLGNQSIGVKTHRGQGREGTGTREEKVLIKDIVSGTIGEDELTQALANAIRGFKAFSVDGAYGDKKYGYFRNILFKMSFLKEHFSLGDSGTTIESGFESLFDAMNNDIQFWDLELVPDELEPKRVKVIDNNTTAYDFENPNFEPLNEKTPKPDKNGKIANPGVFHFPVWQSDSIVKKQNLSAKLPTAMQMAAMYGSNVNAYETLIGTDENLSKTGKAAGLLSKERVLLLDGTRTEKPTSDKYMSHIDLAMRTDIGTPTGDANELLTGGGNFDLPAAITKTGIQQLFKDDLEDRIEQAQERIEESGGDPNDVKLDNSYAGRLIAPELLPGGMSDFLIYLQEIYENKDNVGGEAVVNKIIQSYAKRYRANGKLKKSFVNGTAYLTSKHGSKKSDSLPVLIPLELSLTIDGIGGIFPGNSFHSEYVPTRYQRESMFQMFNVNHTVDSSGWSVELSGKMRATIISLFAESYSDEEDQQNLLKEILSDDSLKHLYDLKSHENHIHNQQLNPNITSTISPDFGQIIMDSNATELNMPAGSSTSTGGAAVLDVKPESVSVGINTGDMEKDIQMDPGGPMHNEHLFSIDSTYRGIYFKHHFNATLPGTLGVAYYDMNGKEIRY
jgi:hypothetical protein